MQLTANVPHIGVLPVVDDKIALGEWDGASAPRRGQRAVAPQIGGATPVLLKITHTKPTGPTGPLVLSCFFFALCAPIHAASGSGDRPVTASLSVKDFGAVGDGVTDDTVPIQAAVTRAAADSTKLVFPPGTYKVTSQIEIPVANQMLDIDGCGASILPAIGPSGSVFQASHKMIDYQSVITIHNFIVTSTHTDSSSPAPLQARAFVEFNGGGFMLATVENIKSNNFVCLGAVVWFSDVNYGFADGITVQNINFAYAAHTAFIVAITRRRDGPDDPRTHVHAHSRFINLINASNSKAVDFGSWDTTLTRGSGEQGCILLDGVFLEDSHIGPFCIGNPHVILGRRGAIIARSVIEGIYCELYQASSVFGASGTPVAVKCELLSCIVQTLRLYFDATSFGGAAHIYEGKAINTTFEKPGISKISAHLAVTDRFIVFAPGSCGNQVDAFYVYSAKGKDGTDAWFVDPSQLVEGPQGAARYFHPRQASALQPSVPLGSSYGANGDFLLATIPAYNLNAKDVITVRGSAHTDGAKGCTVRMSALLGRVSTTTPAMKINTAVGSDVLLEVTLQFTGKSDKTFAANVSYWGFSKAERAGSVLINTNSGAPFGPVDITNHDLQIWLHTSSLVDPLKLTGLTIQHTSGSFHTTTRDVPRLRGRSKGRDEEYRAQTAFSRSDHRMRMPNLQNASGLGRA